MNMVHTLQKITAWLLAVVLAIVLVSSSPEAAFAQRPGVNDKLMEEDTSKSYALPYALVVLGVALGIIIVARPSVRADQARRKVDEEDDE